MKHKKTLTETITITDKVEKVKTYYKKRPWIIVLSIVIAIIGLLLTGPIGGLISFFISIISAFFIPAGKEKIKEIRSN